MGPIDTATSRRLISIRITAAQAHRPTKKRCVKSASEFGARLFGEDWTGPGMLESRSKQHAQELLGIVEACGCGDTRLERKVVFYNTHLTQKSYSHLRHRSLRINAMV